MNLEFRWHARARQRQRRLGVATKTTYATFLLYSLFTSGVLGDEAHNTKALVFNVKGEDLPRPREHPHLRLDDAARYRASTSAQGPRAWLSSPPRRDDPSASADVTSRTEGVTSFFWTIEQFCPRSCCCSLRRRRGRSPAVHAGRAESSLGRRMAQKKRGRRRGRHRGRTIRTFTELVDLIDDKVLDEEDGYA